MRKPLVGKLRACTCMNGGVCLTNGGCECKSGFEGERCGSTEIDFLFNNPNEESKSNPTSVYIILFVVMLLVAAVGLFCFFIWRRFRSTQKEKTNSDQEEQYKNTASKTSDSRIDERLLQASQHIDFSEISNKIQDNCKQMVFCLQPSEMSGSKTPIILQTINETSRSPTELHSFPMEIVGVPRRKRSLAVSR